MRASHAIRRLRAGRGSRRIVTPCLPTLAAVLAASLVVPPTAPAATPAPHWVMTAAATPTDFHPGDSGDSYDVVAFNDGDAATSMPTTITDVLPAGVVVKTAHARARVYNAPFPCEQATAKGVVTVTCVFGAGVGAGTAIDISMKIDVPAGVKAGQSLLDTATISGGGAQEAKTSSATPITEPSTPVPFGVSFVSDVTEAGGNVDVQAGSHPFAFTTMLTFNAAAVDPLEEACFPACSEVNTQAKDFEVELPAGMVGDPTSVPYCKQVQFEQPTNLGCPADSQVGGLKLYFYGGGSTEQYAPVYNIEPPPGQPAELGFSVGGAAHITLFFHLRSDGDYGLTSDASNINQFDSVRMALLSIWGNPSAEVHNPLRASSVTPNCGFEVGCPSGVLDPKPFLTLPTSCTGGPLAIPIAGDAWQQPEVAPFAPLAASSILGMTDCEALQFQPSIAVSASTHRAGATAGYDVHLTVPQNEELEGLATPDVRDVEVALPQGTVLSPSSANGLQACSEAQFQPHSRSAGDCPGASKVATVKVTTPVLFKPLTGSLYVAEPECSPCTPAQSGNGQMVRLYLEVEGSGLVVKLAGHTSIDPTTGQLTTRFTDNPQLPFSELEVELEPGPQAALENPAICGPAVTTATLTPWSSTTPANISAPGIPIEGCADQPFAPSLSAGATPTGHAATFTHFHVSLSRQDGMKTLSRVSVTTPPGLLGVLKSVSQCGEALANAGTCPASSQIGTGSIVAGPGSQPLTVSGTKVFLTGPYAGQPFGLSIVTPTNAGPFLLAGNTGQGTEVVRASIRVDAATSALTITSDPLPQQLNGVPLGIRTINIDVDREGFMFNPTDCDATAINATLAAADGTLSNVTFPFQAQACASLPFKPSFKASTVGQASKRDGVSLDVKVTSKGGPQPGGGEANIAKVKVALPIQLSSRLSTLQLACTDAQFEANPAGCPKESAVGTATASTPLLAQSLSGPAYLVSHGGAAFPDVEIVLQGEGITLVLDGKTDIKHGITTSTFETLPDAPISSFELKLPTGPFSVLGAFVPVAKRFSMCGQNLKMPTTITGQNGAVIFQNTTITATGCARAARAASAGAKTLSKALRACHKNKAKAPRARCERRAHARYGRVA